MDRVKVTVVAAAAVLVVSCSQSTTLNTNIAVLRNTNSTGAVTAVTPQLRNDNAGNTDRKPRLQSAEAVDVAVDETDETYATNCMICHKET